MSKENKKPGEIKDEELRGVSAGGLKEPTPTRGTPTKQAPKTSPVKPDLTTAPTKKKP